LEQVEQTGAVFPRLDSFLPADEQVLPLEAESWLSAKRRQAFSEIQDITDIRFLFA
jgi:hypothetical protein